MTFLDDGQVRIGMDLALGGAVTFISSKDHPGNIINSADLGRQIQMSHYSGPWPFVVGEKKPRKEWAGLGWNPIQTGDCFGNPSRVIEQRNNGKEIYIKCVPMQWPMDNVPGECVFETWTRLEGPVIHMRYRCTNRRSDKTVYRPCPQELPAVYTISKLWRLMSYTGDRPFTWAPLTQLTNDWKKPWPWTHFVATERWAALVGDDDWGLGVFKDSGCQFDGGIYGEGRSANPKDGSTAYVAPIKVENFDYNIVYEHRTDFMVGNLSAIRQRFNAMATKTPPHWSFVHDRQHWTIRNATGHGFPLNGAWRVKFGTERPHLESGVQCWRAQAAPVLCVKAAFKGSAFTARILWRRLDDNNFDENKSLSVDLVPDTRLHVYNVQLGSSVEYRGLITGVAIEPASQAHAGDELTIESVVLLAAPK